MVVGINLDQPANVIWRSDDGLKGDVSTGNKRHFDSVRTAAIFVMEQLSGKDRRRAMITTNQGSLMPTQIQGIYKAGTSDERAPGLTE